MSRNRGHARARRMEARNRERAVNNLINLAAHAGCALLRWQAELVVDYRRNAQ